MISGPRAARIESIATSGKPPKPVATMERLLEVEGLDDVLAGAVWHFLRKRIGTKAAAKHDNFAWVATAAAVRDVRRYLHHIYVSSGIAYASNGCSAHVAPVAYADGVYSSKGVLLDQSVLGAKGSSTDVVSMINDLIAKAETQDRHETPVSSIELHSVSDKIKVLRIPSVDARVQAKFWLDAIAGVPPFAVLQLAGDPGGLVYFERDGRKALIATYRG